MRRKEITFITIRDLRAENISSKIAAPMLRDPITILKELDIYIICFTCFFRKWKSTIQSTTPLIILGFVRLLTTAGVDYQVKFYVCLLMT